MLALCSLASALAGCSERVCTRDAVLAEYVGSANLRDCGEVPNRYPAPPDSSEVYAARDCVLQSTEQMQPFVARWTHNTIEGDIDFAYAGLRQAGAWVTVKFIRGRGVDTSTLGTTTYQCSTLSSQGDCSTLTSSLCVTCVGAAQIDQCEQD